MGGAIGRRRRRVFPGRRIPGIASRRLVSPSLRLCLLPPLLPPSLLSRPRLLYYLALGQHFPPFHLQRCTNRSRERKPPQVSHCSSFAHTCTPSGEGGRVLSSSFPVSSRCPLPRSYFSSGGRGDKKLPRRGGGHLLSGGNSVMAHNGETDLNCCPAYSPSLFNAPPDLFHSRTKALNACRVTNLHSQAKNKSVFFGGGGRERRRMKQELAI